MAPFGRTDQDTTGTERPKADMVNRAAWRSKSGRVCGDQLAALSSGEGNHGFLEIRSPRKI